MYNDLAARKAKDNRDDVAIVRIEQLAPLPKRRLANTLDQYPNAQQYFWVQEEPANQPRHGRHSHTECSRQLFDAKKCLCRGSPGRLPS